MQLSPYLHFNGQCEEAFRFYEQSLGGKITGLQTHGDSPMAAHMPVEWHGKVLHASLTLDGNVLMGSDVPPQHFQKPQGFGVSLVLHDLAKAERIFNALAENGTVRMPFGETFWAAGFGMLVDRFGIPWMVDCERAA
jgi:PhnB protein